MDKLVRQIFFDPENPESGGIVHMPDLIFILLFFMMPVYTLNRALLRAKK